MGSSHFLNPDRPIDDSSGDALGRKGFSFRLADQIAAWKGKESLVLGLHGEWGSGKSSVKNMILERLSSRKEKERPKVVAFNPWMISGDDHVALGFFTEVGRALDDGSLGGDPKKRAAVWKKYSRYFDSAAKLAEASDFIIPLLGGFPLVGGWIAKHLKKASELSGHVAGGLEESSKSFEALRKELKGQFAELERPLLVVIDDIDRLTSEEIRLVFRLVKANADFPNTVFLLLFQKETVVEALNPICNNQGTEFLKKIVQIDLGLPQLSRQKLMAYWGERADLLLDPIINPEDWENERYVNLWIGGLSYYLANLRDITRYLNSFSFVLAGLSSEKTIEVNVLDLIALEVLRIFEPKIYSELAENRHLLTEYLGDYERKEAKTWAESLVEKSAHPLKREGLKKILAELFPGLGHAFGGVFYGRDSWAMEWAKKRRICSEHFFDRYFFLSLPDGALSEWVISEILKKRHDRQGIKSIFADLLRKELVVDAFSRLEAEDSLEKDTDPIPYLLGISDLSDFFPDKTSMYGFAPSMYVRRAVYHVLKDQKDPAFVKSVISKLITESESLYLPAAWLDDVIEPDEKKVYPKIEGEALELLKAAWLNRIRTKANNLDDLLKVTGLIYIFTCWRKWGGENEVIEWVAKCAENPEKMCILLARLRNRGSSQSLGSAYVRDESYLSWKVLENYGSIDFWTTVSTRIASLPSADENQTKMRNFLDAAIKRWKRGIDDSAGMRFKELEDTAPKSTDDIS